MHSTNREANTRKQTNERAIKHNKHNKQNVLGKLHLVLHFKPIRSQRNTYVSFCAFLCKASSMERHKPQESHCTTKSEGVTGCGLHGGAQGEQISVEALPFLDLAFGAPVVLDGTFALPLARLVGVSTWASTAMAFALAFAFALANALDLAETRFSEAKPVKSTAPTTSIANRLCSDLACLQKSGWESRKRGYSAPSPLSITTTYWPINFLKPLNENSPSAKMPNCTKRAWASVISQCCWMKHKTTNDASPYA